MHYFTVVRGYYSVCPRSEPIINKSCIISQLFDVITQCVHGRKPPTINRALFHSGSIFLFIVYTVGTHQQKIVQYFTVVRCYYSVCTRSEQINNKSCIISLLFDVITQCVHGRNPSTINRALFHSCSMLLLRVYMVGTHH